MVYCITLEVILVKGVFLKMRITTKGQVTLPKEIRQRFGLSPGVEVRFVQRGNRVILEKAMNQHPFDTAYGILRSSQRTDHLIEALRGKAV